MNHKFKGVDRVFRKKKNCHTILVLDLFGTSKVNQLTENLDKIRSPRESRQKSRGNVK